MMSALFLAVIWLVCPYTNLPIHCHLERKLFTIRCQGKPYERRYRKAWDIIRDCGFPVVPSQHWLFGSLDIMKSCSTHWQLGKLTRKYGRTYGIMQGSHPTIVTSDPKIIYEICFKQFHLFHSRIMDPSSTHPDTVYEVHEFAARGERWKRIRSLTSKAFQMKISG
ncbi:cytochrome P450 family protein, partial [Wuchereria bancrofti]